MGERTGVGSIDTEQDDHTSCTSCTASRTIAHDVNNALNGVLGHLVSLSNNLKKDKSKDKLDKVLNGLVHVSTLIEKLHEKKSNRKDSFTDLDLSHILHKSCDLFEGDLQKSITLVRKIEEPIYTYGDGHQIQRIILNILMNAKRAIGKDGEITLRLFADPTSRRAMIQISDTGTGIPDEIKGKIFQRSCTTKKSDRHGIGLASVLEIIEQHTGEIEVESEVGLGTTFSISLPQIIPTKQTTIESGFIQPPVGIGKTLLIVDDSSIALEAMTFFMTEAGFNVQAFQNAQKSVSWFDKHKEEVDLVFLDIQIGQDSAIDIYPKIKSLSPTVPVIISSGENTDEVDQILSLGASKFYLKPFDYNGVLDEILSLINRNAIE